MRLGYLLHAHSGSGKELEIHLGSVFRRVDDAFSLGATDFGIGRLSNSGSFGHRQIRLLVHSAARMLRAVFNPLASAASTVPMSGPP